ncbi:MAG: DUF1080 domain-containing protein [bacterium]|nr:DUF1080 domain-containing protein [bacterium]
MNTTRVGMGWGLLVTVVCVVALSACGPSEQPAPTPAPEEPAAPVQPIRQMTKPEPAAPIPETPPAEMPDEGSAAEEGWVVLFDGTDLTGWQNARDHAAENAWTVEGDAMTNKDHGNDIATVDQWKDFDLEIEYKTIPDGNSGVYLRGRVEVQVLDSHGVGQPNTGDAGAIYDQFAPLVNAAKPAGEWHTVETSYVGDRLTVKLNGQLVQDKIQITSVTGGALPGDVNEPGPIMLQGDHGKVWYRNVRVRSHDGHAEGS